MDPIITNEEILTLSREGWQPSQIAKKLGCPVQLIYALKNKAVNAWRTENRYLTQEMFAVTHLRLEDLWAQTLAKLVAAEDPRIFAALVAAALAIVNQQTRLLGINKEGSNSAKAAWDGVSTKVKAPAKFGVIEPKTSSAATG